MRATEGSTDLGWTWASGGRERGRAEVGGRTLKTDPTAAPTALPVIAENVPRRLGERDQWVVWRWTWDARRGDWTKPPYQARTGRRASATDKGTWAPFGVALHANRGGGWDGIGYVVTAGDPFVGIDLDDCRDPATGALDPWAAEIVAGFDSYAEVSPIGTGVRIWVVGSLAGLLSAGREGRRRGPIEVYGGGRFLTVTGRRLDGGRR